MNDQIDYKKVRQGIKETALPFIPFCILMGGAFGVIPLDSTENDIWIFIIACVGLVSGIPIMLYYHRKDKQSLESGSGKQ